MGSEGNSQGEILHELPYGGRRRHAIGSVLWFQFARYVHGARTDPRAGEEGPDAERALDLLDEAEEIHDDWRNLLDHFDFLRNREAVHMKVTNQIENRVMFWSLIEAGLVVSMSVGQVLYWRRFFEQRR